MRTKEQVKEKRKLYCEKVLRAALDPVENFLDIEYIKTPLDAEYIRVISLIGTIAYIDVTALSESAILDEVVELTLRTGKPDNLIDDYDSLRRIAPLFIQRKEES